MAWFGLGLVLGTALGAALGAVEWWWWVFGGVVGALVQERCTNQSHEEQLVSITMKNEPSGGINPERIGKKAIVA